MIALLAAAVVVEAVVLAGVVWVSYHLLRQNGRVLARLEALEAPGAEPSLAHSKIKRDGLQPGTPAPAFRLPTLGGGEVELSDYVGRALLLVFSDPACAPCMALLSRLDAAARVSTTPVLVVSRGSVEANRRKLQETGASLTVALQSHWEISRLYAKFSTPVAYLIDEEGRIASTAACGGPAILSLLGGSEPRLASLPMGSRLAH
jgi:peroxiredoxin